MVVDATSNVRCPTKNHDIISLVFFDQVSLVTIFVVECKLGPFAWIGLVILENLPQSIDVDFILFSVKFSSYGVEHLLELKAAILILRGHHGTKTRLN